MKPLSTQDNNLEKTEKSQQIVEECNKVDINVLFECEKSKFDSFGDEESQNEHSVEQYEIENQVNKEQRRVVLTRLRLRGLSLVFALLVTIFLFGLILTITSVIYLQNNSESHTDSILPVSSRINAINMSSIRDKTSNKEIINSLNSIPKRTQEFANDVSKDSLKTSKFDKTEEPFEGPFLEELVPDSETNDVIKGLVNDLEKGSNEYRLEDLPPTFLDIIKFLRRVFNIPRVRLDYD